MLTSKGVDPSTPLHRPLFISSLYCPTFLHCYYIIPVSHCLYLQIPKASKSQIKTSIRKHQILYVHFSEGFLTSPANTVTSYTPLFQNGQSRRWAPPVRRLARDLSHHLLLFSRKHVLFTCAFWRRRQPVVRFFRLSSQTPYPY